MTILEYAALVVGITVFLDICAYLRWQTMQGGAWPDLAVVISGLVMSVFGPIQWLLQLLTILTGRKFHLSIYALIRGK